MTGRALGFLNYNIKQRLDRYIKETYVECIGLDVFFITFISLLFLEIFFGIFFHTYLDMTESTILIMGISFFITSLALIFKIFSRSHTRKIFTFYLVREFNRERIYVLFFLVNLSFSLLVLVFLTGMPALFGIFVVPVMRVLIMGEDIVVQNRILRAAIKETQTYENLTVFSPMVKQSTYEALMDLTRIKDQMYRSAQASVQSQQMKTELITNISHDLKTPLTSIINYADILSKKTVMDEEAKHYINVLGRNSERLKGLIIDLIEASKTGSGNVNLEPVIIDFNELISQIYADFDSDYQKKGLEFVYETAQEDIPIYTDGNVLSRVIQNIFSNTYKYSLENTRVYARTHLTESRIYFNLKNISKNKLNISVDQLQNQFIRGEKSRTTEGSGLGLYIAKNLVEILEGEFRIVIDGDYFQVFIELPKEIKKL